MLIRYRSDINLSAPTMKVVDLANQIIAEYQGQGITLTLRALYYRFVSRFPLVLDPSGEHPNTVQNYKRLGDILNKGRLGGFVSWKALEDRTRNLEERSHWSSPAAVLEAARSSYFIDMWANQEIRPEVWIEKDAGVGTIERVCEENDVAYFSCRGNCSQSEMWEAGMRLRRYLKNGQTPMIFYLGDHDPNGVDMTRDVRERLTMFCGRRIIVERLLLNLDQIEQFNPPPNPVKNTDSRANGYRAMIADHNEENGTDWDPDTCWEMDALDPSEVVRIVQEAIDNIRDPGALAERQAEFEADQKKLDDLIAQLDEG